MKKLFLLSLLAVSLLISCEILQNEEDCVLPPCAFAGPNFSQLIVQVCTDGPDCFAISDLVDATFTQRLPNNNNAIITVPLSELADDNYTVQIGHGGPMDLASDDSPAYWIDYVYDLNLPALNRTITIDQIAFEDLGICECPNYVIDAANVSDRPVEIVNNTITLNHNN